MGNAFRSWGIVQVAGHGLDSANGDARQIGQSRLLYELLTTDRKGFSGYFATNFETRRSRFDSARRSRKRLADGSRSNKAEKLVPRFDSRTSVQ